MPFAPSVGMHEVPRNTVGKEIGILGEGADESDEEELDVIINRSSLSVLPFFLVPSSSFLPTVFLA